MLWISDQWKDYEVLDTSDGEKLERWGKYFLVRPDPQVIWKTPAAGRRCVPARERPFYRAAARQRAPHAELRPPGAPI